MTPLSPTARTTPEDVAVALEYAALGVPLSEVEARHDLAQADAPRPDAWWGQRWGWRAEDVDTLRRTDWRLRDELPTNGRAT